MKQGKFLRIICPKCKKQTIIFGKSSAKIKCSECNKTLTKPLGGKAKILAKIKQIWP